MVSLQDELIALIDGSLTIGQLRKDEQERLRDRLLSLPEEEMEQAIEVLRREQQQQYEAMKGLVDEIEAASRDLKKAFLKEREKEEAKTSEEEVDDLMQKLDTMA